MSTLSELQAEREVLIGRLSVSLFHIFGILFVPVVASVFLGNFLDKKYGTGDLVTFGLACLVMGISWIYIWKIYKKIDNKMIELDRLIIKEKESIKKEDI
ncbi:MAG: hypothetical protein RI996_139 [Candidatus Parcubacteria bacterium]|jgi:hypothetical protein